MKSKKSFFFGIAILVIYIITVLSYILALFAEYKNGPSRAEFRFTELVRETNQNLKINNPHSEAFATTFLRSIGSMSDIAGIQLVSDGDLIMSIPKNLPENTGHSSALITTRSSNLVASDGSSVTLTAAIYLLKPSSIKTKGITAFIVILAATLCCVGYLIISSILGKSQDKNDGEKSDETKDLEQDEEPEEKMATETKENESEADDSAIDQAIPDVDSSDSDFDLSDTDFDEPKFDEPKFDEPKFDEPKFDEPAEQDFEEQEPESGGEDFSSSDYDDDASIMPLQIASNITQEEYQALTKDLLPEEDTDSIETSLSLPSMPDTKRTLAPEEMVLKPLPPLETKKEVEERPRPEKRRTVPEGLFSSITGFCWEEYMLPRLDSELMRAASSDQDLALLTLSIPKFNWDSESGKAVCKLIQDTFRFRDMIFEYGDSGCTIIILGLSSKQVKDKAENLHTDIIAGFAKRHEYHIVSIGIANRALRLISGSRLANESVQALLRAQSDTDSPIVEFKIDFEKYKNFIVGETTRTELAEKRMV